MKKVPQFVLIVGLLFVGALLGSASSSKAPAARETIKRIGGCQYAVAYSSDGGSVSITHAGNCDNRRNH